MADLKDNNLSVILVLVKRFESQRLPHAQALKAKVDSGGLLNETDIAFLRKVREDARYIRPLARRHPECGSFVAQATALYKDITAKALKNEAAVRTHKH